MKWTPNVGQINLTLGVIFMSKYSVELKLEIVKKYLLREYSALDLQKEYNVSRSLILEWIHKYELHGTKGLIKNQKSSYSGDFKKSVVEYMHANHLSGAEAAEYFNLGNRVVYKWERIYYEEGPDALYEERRGRPRMSSKPKKKEINEKDKEDLIAEVQRLRAENAYLKKLRALVQERIQQEQKKK